MESLKNFRKKGEILSLNAEKSERDPLGFFNIRSNANKLNGAPLGDIKKFKKSLSKPKKGCPIRPGLGNYSLQLIDSKKLANQ